MIRKFTIILPPWRIRRKYCIFSNTFSLNETLYFNLPISNNNMGDRSENKSSNEAAFLQASLSTKNNKTKLTLTATAYGEPWKIWKNICVSYCHKPLSFTMRDSAGKEVDIDQPILTKMGIIEYVTVQPEKSHTIVCSGCIEGLLWKAKLKEIPKGATLYITYKDSDIEICTSVKCP
jgi:hypothetical protein